ncbi:unnamed protein product [Caenorhabditis bovis]|uniref:Uncharacterized protein n=1 Tax=Caenorhabditis bovis TaxID=2654633 RepID=A0A8S1F4I3_9PELO|nr:unnamed protein product [Caenorhabditis bovis]
MLWIVVLLFAAAYAQYGVPQQPPQYAYPPFVIDNYVCSADVSYPVFNAHRGRKYRGSKQNFCLDTYRDGGCETCCRMAARIEGTNIDEADILGLTIVRNKKSICICCAPNNAGGDAATYGTQTVADPAANTNMENNASIGY